MSILQQYGQETTVGTPIQRLRRTELHKIARAHDIKVKPNCIKKKILPLIQEAVEEGLIDPDNILKGAKHPHFLTGEKAPNQKQVVASVSDEKLTTVHLGNAMKWCVMQGDTILHKGLVTKEEADGYHVPTSG